MQLEERVKIYKDIPDYVSCRFIPQVCGFEGNTLLHLCAHDQLEEAGLFLVDHGADLNRTNSKGETGLHIAASRGLSELSKAILKSGANPDLQTSMSPTSSEVYRQTALHLAILNKYVDVIKVILEQAQTESGQKPNLNLKNSADQTPLSLALSNGLHDIAVELLKGCNELT